MWISLSAIDHIGRLAGAPTVIVEEHVSSNTLTKAAHRLTMAAVTRVVRQWAGAVMCTQIMRIHRTADGDVDWIGGDNWIGFGVRPAWGLFRDYAIQLIQSNEWHFFVERPGADGKPVRAAVIARMGLRGWYLTTETDGPPPNNLRNMPKGDPTIGELPSLPGLIPPARQPVLTSVLRPGTPPVRVAALPRAQGRFPIPAGSFFVDINAPWPGDFEIRHGRVWEERQNLAPLVRAPSGTASYPSANVQGWWSVQDLVGGTHVTANGRPSAARWRLLIRPPNALVHTTMPTMPTKVFIQHVSDNLRCPAAKRISQPLTFQTMRGSPRRNINELSATDQEFLATLILGWINDARVEQHSRLTHDQTEGFLSAHRDWIAQVEEYLVKNGAGRFVPLPMWDPANEIPQAFRAVKPDDNLRPRQGLGNTNPNRPLPISLRQPALCDLQDGTALASTIYPWHQDVHINGVGGAMAPINESAACAISYPWHAFVDEVYWTWQQCL